MPRAEQEVRYMSRTRGGHCDTEQKEHWKVFRPCKSHSSPRQEPQRRPMMNPHPDFAVAMRQRCHASTAQSVRTSVSKSTAAAHSVAGSLTAHCGRKMDSYDAGSPQANKAACLPPPERRRNAAQRTQVGEAHQCLVPVQCRGQRERHLGHHPVGAVRVRHRRRVERVEVQCLMRARHQAPATRTGSLHISVRTFTVPFSPCRFT